MYSIEESLKSHWLLSVIDSLELSRSLLLIS
jgi:hypothetical protein